MSLVVCPPVPNLTSRQMRHRDTRRKLSSILFEALAALSDVAVVGADPLVTYFAVSLELEPASLAACQAMLDGKPVTLVGVPSRLWYQPDAMERLLALKTEMQKCGRSCVLLPQRAITMLESREARDQRVKLLIDLIRDPTRMGGDRACSAHKNGDPIGCRAMQLLTGNDCLP